MDKQIEVSTKYNYTENGVNLNFSLTKDNKKTFLKILKEAVKDLEKELK